MSIDNEVDKIFSGESIKNMDRIDRATFLFKTFIDTRIEFYAHSMLPQKKTLDEIFNYIFSDSKIRISFKKKEYLLSNMEFILDEFARGPIKKKREAYTDFAMRDNGINYRVSHYINVAKILADNGHSFERIIVALNHDVPEDHCEFIEESRGEGLRKSGFDEEEVKKRKKLSENEIREKANEKIEDICNFWKSSGLNINYNLIEEGITKVTRFNKQDYQGDISDIFEYENDPAPVYLAVNVKIADRIHNIKTMRPIEERQNIYLMNIHEKLGISEESYKQRLFKFEEIYEVFKKNGDLSDYKEYQIANHEEHEKVKKIVAPESKHNIDHFFNTTEHSFIVKNLYKNMILLNQVNQFLSKQKNKRSRQYRSTQKLKQKLIDSSFEEIIFQFNHSLRNHIDLDYAGQLFREAEDYKKEGKFRSLTKRSEDSSFDGVILDYLNPLMNNEEGFYPPREFKEILNVPGGHEDEKKRFGLYVSLFYIFKEFNESKNFYFDEPIGGAN